MAYVRGNNRPFPVRPLVSNPPPMPRVLVHYRSPRPIKQPPPMNVPVLQPPFFPKEYNMYENEQDQYGGEMYYYPTVAVADQHRTMTREFIHRIPTYMSVNTRYHGPIYPSYMY